MLLLAEEGTSQEVLVIWWGWAIGPCASADGLLCQAAIAKGVFVCLATGKARPAAIKAMTMAGLAGKLPALPSFLSSRSPLYPLCVRSRFHESHQAAASMSGMQAQWPYSGAKLSSSLPGMACE